MAKDKTTTEAEKPQDDTVEMMLPLVPGEPDTIFVGLNGKGYTIQRGETVRLPKPVAAIIQDSQRAKQAQQARMRQLAAEAAKPKVPG
jgi:hypothetical protein